MPIRSCCTTCTAPPASVADKLKAFGCDEVVTGHRPHRRGRRHPRPQAGGGRQGDRAARRHGRAADRGGDRRCPTSRPCPARCTPAAMTATPRCCSAPRKYLAETRNFAGTAVVIFQPAEEGGAGGKAMVEDGLMERFGIEEVYGMHNYPGHAGRRSSRSGRARSWRRPTTSTIEIEGKGGARGAAASGDRHRAGRRADHQPDPVDRVAQRRSAEVGGGLDLHVPGRHHRQRHPADRAAARHRAQPDAGRARPAGEAPAARSSRAPRGCYGAKAKLDLPARLSGARATTSAQTDFAAAVAGEIVGGEQGRHRRSRR